MHGKDGKIFGSKNIKWGSCRMKKQWNYCCNVVLLLLTDAKKNHAIFHDVLVKIK